jgi:hypothetical protein
LATKSGSVESLNVSIRCGCKPKARQMRSTLETDKPLVFAMPRELQCVAFLGTLAKVVTITASTRASSIVRGAPERA